MGAQGSAAGLQARHVREPERGIREIGFGDELLVTGHVRELHLKDPRKVRLVYEKTRHWSPVFDNNPKIAHWSETGDFQEFRPRVNGLRPYCRDKSETKWTWQNYKPIPGELFFTEHETHFDQCEAQPCDVVVGPHIKGGASPNKDWGWERWQRLVQILVENRLRVVQVGPPGARVLSGTKLLPSSSFRRAAAYIATMTKAAVFPEGGLHHAAAAVGRKAVVLFGGYISPSQTGYDLHANIFTGGEPCGMRIPCKHCQDAMAQITPERVFEEVKKIL